MIQEDPEMMEQELISHDFYHRLRGHTNKCKAFVNTYCTSCLTLGCCLLTVGGVHVDAGGPSCLPGAGGGWPSGPGAGSPCLPGGPWAPGGGGYSPGPV